MMKTLVEEIAISSDARGCVFEPLSGEALRRQGNVHVVVTLPGQARGNHYHVKGIEILVVRGPALVRHRDEAEVTETVVPEGCVVRFSFPPGVPHAIRCTGSQPGLLVAFNSEAHDPSRPDTVPFPLFEESGLP
ncbi:MAG: hypothetical protein MUC41_01290 [Syntrophobacteraceae bacterium]|jgi:UDP-2-acetamido-2,6-beta-L-arabino-hexul-4-ose reductase|nr:hypothetical protein [Syntrophobacteraceae bacterium]